MSDSSDATFAPAGSRVLSGPHRILVIGGGAGGLELAVRLGKDLGRRKAAEIVLVDPALSHVWKPLLHEVAAGTLVAEENAFDFLQQARQHHFRFHLGSLAGLDRARKEVVLAPLHDETGELIAPERRLWYDTLVVAVGCQDNDFGVPGVREHAYSLNGTEDAQRFNRRLLALLGRAELQNRGPVHVVVVGGGATGVELAAELVDASKEVASYGLRLRRLHRPLKISLIDNNPRILSAMPDPVADRAQADLVARGVALLPGHRVAEVRADRVIVSVDDQNRELPADLTAWAAGVSAPEFLSQLDGLETNKIHQLVVTPTLQTTRDPDVFAFGDCASCTPTPGAKPVPPKAQAAHQEARFLAHALAARLEGRPLPSFDYHDRGSLVSLGQSEAVGNVADQGKHRSLLVEGTLARWSYLFLYRRHLATLLGWTRTLLIMLRDWVSGRIHPPVKLH